MVKVPAMVMMGYMNGPAILLVLLSCVTAAAIEPNDILVIVNGDIDSSVELGRYYCQRRYVPEKNILALPLGKALADTISRDEYDSRIAGPVRERLAGISGWAIKCLLTTYGVPYKVGPRGPLKDQQEHLKQFQASAERYEKELANLQQGTTNGQVSAGEQTKIKTELARVRGEIDWITGNQTAASVDSELSMVRFGAYELHLWRPNQFYINNEYHPDLFLTVMVCRLDGPTPGIARGLIDKAIYAEKTGLHGFAYIDSRGIPDDKTHGSYGNFDQKLRNLAVLLRFRTTFEVKEERTEKLFEPGSCPRTAIYCGWHSLKKYVDSFDFVDGAIGYHVASFEAVDLRDANSTEWCPSMLVHGVTATLGPVNEPYLHAFPNPQEFFLELIDGKCLVEAFWRTQPSCSWQMVLIGDPLYKPFGK